MIRIQQVFFQRAEGDRHECQPRTFFSLAQADLFVRTAARTAPDDGSYHKCDAVVVWDDGTKWAFRFDMTYGHVGHFSAFAHDFKLDLAWHTGIMAAPDGASEEERAQAIVAFDKMYPGRRELANKILTGDYEVRAS